MSGVWVVGTGLAGHTLARELRKLRPEVEITLVTRDAGDFYSKPALSNAVSAGLAPEQLVQRSAEQMAAQLQVRILQKATVESLDTAGQRLCIDGEWHRYDQLVLALGADAVVPPVAGLAPDALLRLNDLDDYRALWARLGGARRIAVLGAGLIGCEIADDLSRAGHQVCLFDLAEHPLSRLVPREIGEGLRAALQARGIVCHFGAPVTHAQAQGAAWRLFTSRGDSTVADVVLGAAGVRPRVELARQAGLLTDKGIVVDRRLKTSAERVYALGDCAQIDGLLLPFVMPLMRSAKALARTLAGDPTDVVFPCMPVVAKTPSFPVVVAPVVDGSPFRWEKAGEGSGHRAWCKDANDQVRGFALGGEAVGERFRWERSVAAWLAADAPISEAAPVQASNP
ncbi:FAD-dependent oxidoreductase [Hydrogenophaga borbori]